jgi:hypothetical protein
MEDAWQDCIRPWGLVDAQSTKGHFSSRLVIILTAISLFLSSLYCGIQKASQRLTTDFSSAFMPHSERDAL